MSCGSRPRAFSPPAGPLPRSGERLVVPAAVRAEVVARARAALPHECVGLLLGTPGTALESVALPNVSTTPRTRFEAEPGALLAALRRADLLSLEPVATYHSHPNGSSRPSEVDVREAAFGAPCVIVTPGGQLRAFRLDGGRTVELDVVPADGGGDERRAQGRAHE